ncbi:transcription initiation factor TFIID subunit A-domain-containing protein [Cunninghamella echinulata]|nr:transcription initiation factor TFIID subunit A-domain-containing protein [Cunninghamella echinulata]
MNISTSASGTVSTPTATTKQQKKAAVAAAQAAAQQNTANDILDTDGIPRVLAKRKIQELVSQIDPTERLEPEVEDILLEVADEFIESVTTFACRLAKHRKSDTLEVKDLQLHLERNWNIRIPGFASDDIRSIRKPTVPSSYMAKVQAVNNAKLQPSSRKEG